MRTLIPSLVSLGLAASAAALSSTPAAAVEYAYCLQGRMQGIPGDCNYRTYAECSATASGRDAFCNVNPRFAFAAQNRRARPARRGYNNPNNNNGPDYPFDGFSQGGGYGPGYYRGW